MKNLSIFLFVISFSLTALGAISNLQGIRFSPPAPIIDKSCLNYPSARIPEFLLQPRLLEDMQKNMCSDRDKASPFKWELNLGKN